jgi:hypothetical protein
MHGSLVGVLSAALVLVATGCKCDPTESRAHAIVDHLRVAGTSSGVTVNGEQQLAPTIAPSPAPTAYVASVASFANNKLNECMDVLVPRGLAESLCKRISEKHPDKPCGQASQVAETLVEALASPKAGAKKQSKQMQPLAKSCAVQFSARTTFGRCSANIPLGDAGTDGMFTVSNATYTVKGIDGRMRECLGMKGEWWELDRNSLEYQQAALGLAMDQ